MAGFAYDASTPCFGVLHPVIRWDGASVDGVYDADPKKNKDAKRFNKLSYFDFLSKNLKVMDATAVALCEENRLPIYVFDFFSKGALKKAVLKEPVGTLVFGE